MDAIFLKACHLQCVLLKVEVADFGAGEGGVCQLAKIILSKAKGALLIFVVVAT